MLNKPLLMGWVWILTASSAPVLSSGNPVLQGAHVHGEAVLNVVQEGTTVYIEFESPAINLVGFEHAPINPEQKAALSNARQILAATDCLFQFDATQCLLESKEINVPYPGQPAHKHPHRHEHESAQEAHHEHADFQASYTFQCEQASDLRAISTTLFSLFPGIQTIKVQWISQGRHGSTSLLPTDATLRLN